MAAYRAPTTCADWGRGQRTCNLQIWKRMAAFWAADSELIHGLGGEIMSGVGVGQNGASVVVWYLFGAGVSPDLSVYQDMYKLQYV